METHRTRLTQAKLLTTTTPSLNSFSYANLFRGPYYFQQKNRRGHCERIKRCHRRQYDMCQGHLESRHACAVIPNTNQLPIDPSLRAGSELQNRVDYYYCKKVVEYQKVFSIYGHKFRPFF